MDTNQYINMFVDEAMENLKNLNQLLLQLEMNKSDASLLNGIFRIMHTLKGMSSTMGFEQMAELTHAAEDVMQEVKNGKTVLNEHLINCLFLTMDTLENHVKEILNNGNEGMKNYDELLRDLREIVENKGNSKNGSEFNGGIENKEGSIVLNSSDKIMQLDTYVENAIKKAHEMGFYVYKITIHLDKGCILKAARAFVVFKTLEEHSDIIKSEPSVLDIEDEKFTFTFSVIVISKENKDDIIRDLYKVAEVEKVELDVIGSKSEASNKNIQAAENESKGVPSAKNLKFTKTIRVEVDRLDLLLNLVGELVIQKTRLESAYNENQQVREEYIQQLEKIILNLHDTVMKVRMVPVEIVFNRFPRMVRDLSKSLGKKIVLEMYGEETELDRTIVDEIGEPLVHLIRNSIDHGIELPQKRLSLGKPEEGHIELRAYQSGNNVIIEVNDDGQGIDIDKVKVKAVEKGILSHEEIKNASEKEILELLFLPNMSTTDTINNISGRGVGLDAVKSKIESLGGTIEIITKHSKGTKFVISLPLTLAMIQALIVSIGNEKYAIPLDNVKRIVKIKLDEIKEVQKREILVINDTIIPIIKLSQLLSVPTNKKQSQNAIIVIINKSGKLWGVMVDELIGQQEIVIKNIGKYLSNIKAISGATILSNGKVALILNLNSFIQ